MINGEIVEGSPSEILEYERLLQGSETTVARAAGGEPFRAGGMVIHRIGIDPDKMAGHQDSGLIDELAEQKANKSRRYRSVSVSNWQYLVLDTMRKSTLSDMSVAEIAAETGLLKSEISSVIRKLMLKKLVVRVNGTWRWQLTDRGANCPTTIARSRK